MYCLCIYFSVLNSIIFGRTCLDERGGGVFVPGLGRVKYPKRDPIKYVWIWNQLPIPASGLARSTLLSGHRVVETTLHPCST